MNAIAQHHQIHGVQPVLQPPTDQPWGLRETVLQAPGGHRLVLGAESTLPGR